MIGEIIETVLGLLEAIKIVLVGKELAAKKQDRKDELLTAVIAAAQATEIYIKKLKSQKADRDTEFKLALHWEECGYKIWEFDQDLSSRFNLKSLYWKNRREWTPEDVREARIGVKRVKKEAIYLLKLNVKPSKKVKMFLEGE